MAEIANGFTQKLNTLNRKMNLFFSFIGTKLKNFPRLSLGEKIAFPSIGVGILCILVSIILFVV